MIVRIATRQSKLALWQASFVRARLQEAHPGIDVQLVAMATRGDRWLSSPLAEVGGKGLFIKELEEALEDGRADLAVHSMKDVPAVLPPGFCLPVVGYREDVRDVLVAPAGTLAQLPAGARVGSSSLRRKSQLLARRPDLDVLPIRGNVDTRLGKLDAGEFDAIVLAMAGLNRLGLEGRASECFAADLMVPAAGQGALGIECARGDERVLELLDALDDSETRTLVGAERAVAAGLGADCTTPLGVYAQRLSTGEARVDALLASEDGRQILRATHSGPDPETLSAAIVEDLFAQGAARLLEATGS